MDAADQRELFDGLIALGDGLAFNQHLGVRVLELEPGRCRTLLPADDRLANHIGGVHAIAELAPVELAGGLAASGRLAPLLARGYIPVVGGLQVRYTAAARGDLVATAEVAADQLPAAVAAAEAGERPRATANVEVSDDAGTVVLVAELHFVYLHGSELAG